jgi:hypothetical protein
MSQSAPAQLSKGPMNFTHIAIATTFLAAAVAFSAGCSGGDTSSSGTPTSKRGYVSCNGQTCNPGQHCDNGYCGSGCQSDDNCLETSACQNISDVTKVGTCAAKTVTPPPPAGRCAGLFANLATCTLLDATEVAAAETDTECGNKFSDDQIKVIKTCVSGWNCAAPIPQCLQGFGLRCGGAKYTCPAGKKCTTALDVQDAIRMGDITKVAHTCQ